MKKTFKLRKLIAGISFALVSVITLSLLTSCSLFTSGNARLMAKAQSVVNEVADTLHNFEERYFPTQSEATSSSLQTVTGEGAYQGDAVEQGGSMATLFADIPGAKVEQYSELKSYVGLADRLVMIVQNAFFAGNETGKVYSQKNWVNPKSDSDRQLNAYFEYIVDSNRVTFNLYYETSSNQALHARFEVFWTKNYDFILQGIAFADSTGDNGVISPFFVRVDKLKGANTYTNFELAIVQVNAEAFKAERDITIDDIQSMGTDCEIYNFESKTRKAAVSSSDDETLTQKSNEIKTYIANFIKSCKINNAGLSQKETIPVEYFEKFLTETSFDWMF